jgi:hypothetical protein
MPVLAVEIKPSNKHVEAAIPVILGRGFNSLRLHGSNRILNPQVTLKALLAGFLLSQIAVSMGKKPVWFQKIGTRGSNFCLTRFQFVTRSGGRAAA